MSNRPEVEGIEGCTDGGCIFGHPGGMHTNGGCACMRELRPFAFRRRMVQNIQLYRREILRLKQEANWKQHAEQLEEEIKELNKRLADLYTKDSVKTHEINALTRENRALRETFGKLGDNP